MAVLGTRRLAAVVGTIASLVLVSSTPGSADDASLTADVTELASDAYGGRATGTDGSTRAQGYITERLRSAGYRRDNGRLATQDVVDGGTDIVATLPGSGSLADDGYVLVGAHYDHLDPASVDPRCRRPDGDDVLCNGATDNAAGVAVLLDMAARLADSAPASRRRVAFVFWDAEEDRMQGSVTYRLIERAFGAAPPVAYVNYDIQGANLRRSLRDSTFAVGASSGGPRLSSAVAAAAATATEGREVAVHQLTEPFGQYRSDYATFLAPDVVSNVTNPDLPADLPRVPTVFFTDGSGPCYHTPGDETEIVDVDKLVRQADIGARLVRDLVSGPRPTLQDLPDDAEAFGEWVGATSELLDRLGPGLGLGLRPPYPRIPPPTFDDAAEVLQMFGTATGDPTLAPGSQWAINLYWLQLVGIYMRGPSAYDPMVQGKTVALAALAFMRPMENGTCDGFLTP